MSSEHTVTSVAQMSVQLDEALAELSRAQVREARLVQEIDTLRTERSTNTLKMDDATERANMLQALLETVSASIVMGLQRYSRLHATSNRAKQEARLGVGGDDTPLVARPTERPAADAPVKRRMYLRGQRPPDPGKAWDRITDDDTGKEWEFVEGHGWTAVGGMVQRQPVAATHTLQGASREEMGAMLDNSTPARRPIREELEQDDNDDPPRPAPAASLMPHIPRRPSEPRTDIVDSRLPPVTFASAADRDQNNLRAMADRIAPERPQGRAS